MSSGTSISSTRGGTAKIAIPSLATTWTILRGSVLKSSVRLTRGGAKSMHNTTSTIFRSIRAARAKPVTMAEFGEGAVAATLRTVIVMALTATATRMPAVHMEETAALTVAATEATAGMVVTVTVAAEMEARAMVVVAMAVEAAVAEGVVVGASLSNEILARV